METTFETITQGPLALPCPQVPPVVHSSFASRRIAAVFEAAQEVPFDDRSRFVLFSDCHRGDNSRADDFAKNEDLFLRVLSHYYQEGFSYIEVGDGDELWKNRRFRDIREAHGRVFDLLHQFDAQQRLHLILGNHDIQGNCRHQMNKDGMLVREGLVLKHRRHGQQVFVFHGHQADFKSDRLYQLSRFAVRRVWRRLQLLNIVHPDKELRLDYPRTKFEHKIVDWALAHRQLTICGHTHHPIGAGYGASPYFNTGCCINPGVLTGLEIQGGEITLMQWRARPVAPLGIERTLLVAPKKLTGFV